MIIQKRRIRNLDNYLHSLKNNESFIIGIKEIQRFNKQLIQAGFSKKMEVGERILPNFSFGPVSSYNAEGTYEIHKDKPMETAYREAEWTWTEWHGRYDRVERTKTVDVPYKRYPRTFIPPPSVEISVDTNSQGKKVVISEKFTNKKSQQERILHTINLFLEIFGEATVLNENLESFYVAPIKRLNWRVLPEGKMPWEKLEEKVKPIIDKAAKGNRNIISNRFETINKNEPDFVAVGQAGFDGYVIFAFPNKKLFVCESIHPDNATYIFDDNWEELSQKTKAEILDNNYQKDRIIHREHWHTHIKKLFK